MLYSKISEKIKYNGKPHELARGELEVVQSRDRGYNRATAGFPFHIIVWAIPIDLTILHYISKRCQGSKTAPLPHVSSKSRYW